MSIPVTRRADDPTKLYLRQQFELHWYGPFDSAAATRAAYKQLNPQVATVVHYGNPVAKNLHDYPFVSQKLLREIMEE